MRRGPIEELLLRDISMGVGAIMDTASGWFSRLLNLLADSWYLRIEDNHSTMVAKMPVNFSRSLFCGEGNRYRLDIYSFNFFATTFGGLAETFFLFLPVRAGQRGSKKSPAITSSFRSVHSLLRVGVSTLSLNPRPWPLLLSNRP
jgi:hypothetical protein